MALSPEIDYSVDVVAGTIQVTDGTTYGDGASDPARGDALVNFTATFKPVSGDEAIPLTYDETDVASVTFSTIGDGVYEVEMTITPASGWGGSDFNYTQKVVLLVTPAFTACYIAKALEYMRAKCECGCKDADLLMDLFLACETAGIAMTQAADYDRAQCIIEEAAALCASDCNC